MHKVASISGVGTEYEIVTDGTDYTVLVSSGPRVVGLAWNVSFRQAMETVTDAIEKEMAEL